MGWWRRRCRQAFWEALCHHDGGDGWVRSHGADKRPALDAQPVEAQLAVRAVQVAASHHVVLPAGVANVNKYMFFNNRASQYGQRLTLLVELKLSPKVGKAMMEVALMLAPKPVHSLHHAELGLLKGR